MEIEIIYNFEKKRAECLCDFNDKDVPKSAGFWWDPDDKRWWTSDRRKVSKIPTRTKGKNETLSEMEKEGERVIAESVATDASIEIPSPEELEYLPFQKAGIFYASKKEGVLIADEMGLGKTIQALGTVNYLSETLKKVLVICPASLRINWGRESEKWLVDDWKISVLTSKSKEIPEVAEMLENDDRQLLIMGYETVVKFRDGFIDRDWDMLIVDEAHYLKNMRSKRTQSILGRYPTKKPIQTKRKILLTGTPILNRPMEIYGMVTYLQPEIFGGYKKYMQTFCNNEKKGASNLEVLQEKLRTSCMIRRMKKDVLKHLQPKTRTIIEIPADNTEAAQAIKNEKSKIAEWKKLHKEFKKELAVTKGDKEKYNETIKNMRSAHGDYFSELATLRRETSEAKVPFVVNHVDNMLKEGVEKIVVFTYHRQVAKMIGESLNALVVTGENSQEERDDAIRIFQEEDTHSVFVGTMKSVGVGVTLTASSYVVFAELDWVPATISQAEDRCHRIGQNDRVFIQHTVLAESIDVLLAKTLVKKQKIIEKTMNIDELRQTIKLEHVT